MNRLGCRILGPVGGAMLATGLLCGAPGEASALTSKECHAKFNDAKTAGTLNGLTSQAFRTAQCDTAAAATPAPGTATSPAASTTATTTGATTAATPTTASPGKGGTASPVDTGNMVFPAAIAPKYASETAGKARMHTCRDQYEANKTTSGNGGHKWIEKGDGYYSECSKHLKG